MMLPEIMWVQTLMISHITLGERRITFLHTITLATSSETALS